MEQQAEAASNSTTSRRHFLDILLGANLLGWLASVASGHSLSQAAATNRSRRTDAFDAR
jgi:hypothetical protein